MISLANPISAFTPFHFSPGHLVMSSDGDTMVLVKVVKSLRGEFPRVSGRRDRHSGGGNPDEVHVIRTYAYVVELGNNIGTRHMAHCQNTWYSVMRGGTTYFF